jgi:hypothetical protein
MMVPAGSVRRRRLEIEHDSSEVAESADAASIDKVSMGGPTEKSTE